MSPEHLSGRHVDVRADVYALGLIVYEMMVGLHPFVAEEDGAFGDVYELGAMQLFAEPRPLPTRIAGFPDHVWQVIRRAVAKNPNDRHPSMAQFAAELRAGRTRFLKEIDPLELGARQQQPVALARPTSNYPPQNGGKSRGATAITIPLATVGAQAEPRNEAQSSLDTTDVSDPPSIVLAADLAMETTARSGPARTVRSTPPGNAAPVPPGNAAPVAHREKARMDQTMPPSRAAVVVASPNAQQTRPLAPASSGARPTWSARHALAIGLGLGPVMAVLLFLVLRALPGGTARTDVPDGGVTSFAPDVANSIATSEPAVASAEPPVAPVVATVSPVAEPLPTPSKPVETKTSDRRQPPVRTADPRPPVRTAAPPLSNRLPASGLPKAGL
jgi:serine/threonine-protein kinase